MIDKIEELLIAIKADYYKWTSKNGTKELSEINKEMIEEFNDAVKFNVATKYIKVTVGGSVWGFVVNTDADKKFKKGDILKAAGWSTPARNAARGNVIEGGYNVSWTGATYLK